QTDEKLFETEVLMITTTPYREGKERLNLKEISERTNISLDDISIRISNGLAKLASHILKLNHSFSGVFCTGGDITVALSKETNAMGIEIREEILPLVAYGRIMGGDFPQLRIISKGGMVGDKFAMSKCINKLKNI
ncbi:nucleotide-binding domain containing protein, partial [Peptoniphilus asaccharolyticus]